MIFMNLLGPQLAGHRAENARADRLVLGRLIRTAALLVEANGVLPSCRRISFAVRTMTARWMSPFLTLPRGIASFTETTITSPTAGGHALRAAEHLDALHAPGTRVVRHFEVRGLHLDHGLVALLSLRPAAPSRRLLHMTLPGLGLGDRPAFADPDTCIARACRRLVLVMGVRSVLERLDELLVDRVHHAALDAARQRSCRPPSLTTVHPAKFDAASDGTSSRMKSFGLVPHASVWSRARCRGAPVASAPCSRSARWPAESAD